VTHHASTGLETRRHLDRPLTLSEQIAVADEMTKRVLHPIGTLANLVMTRRGRGRSRL
jgi:hypothetical protein